MEPLFPASSYVAQNSKKRVFPGASSSQVEPEVVEIHPRSSRSGKLKSPAINEVLCHEIIDVEENDDCDDIISVNLKDKGKACSINATNVSVGSVHSANFGSVDEVMSSKMRFNKLNKLDDFDSNLNEVDIEYLDKYYQDIMYDDDYTILQFLQSQFDNMEIPPGVEATIPLLLESALKKKTNVANYSATSPLDICLDDRFSSGKGFSQLSKPYKMKEKFSSKSSSSLQNQVGSFDNPQKIKKCPSMSTWQKKNSSSCSQTQNGVGSLPPEMEQFKLSNMFHSPDGLIPSFSNDGMKNSMPNEYPYVGWPFASTSGKMQVGSKLLSPNVYLDLAAKDCSHVSEGIDSWGTLNSNFYMIPPVNHGGFVNQLDTMSTSSGEEAHNVQSSTIQHGASPASSGEEAYSVRSSTIQHGSSSSGGNLLNEDEIKQKFHLFKNFDTVPDCLDHHYLQASVNKPSKNWAKKIQDEWKILENNLPDSIYVRVCEARMDLLRAVIIGAEGTPYHDGLFFFDVFFPERYPNIPPLVYYHAHGHRLNPNLYNCGKVCLSLLNTWSGSLKEKWIPAKSTALQVLVSIQGLILNSKPFFNEPGYECMSGSAEGKKMSLEYNEATFILSLKTMVGIMRRPPKCFEDFVLEHFSKRAIDILVACKSYMEGAQVGCLVKGGVQDVDEGDKSCSAGFKRNLAAYMNTLVNAFTKIGVKDCEKFLPSPSSKPEPFFCFPKNFQSHYLDFS